MKLAALFSGGKDSTYAGFLAKEAGHELVCLITLVSQNQDSYMFHTPSISATEKQAKAMGLPIILQETKGEKEEELKDLTNAITKAKEDYGIEGVITGAVGSVYQATRVQRICNELGLEVFNPLWQQDQETLLHELVKNKFKIIIVGVAAYPLGKEWLGKEVDEALIKELLELQNTYQVNPAGEGGEFETLVLDCPLYKEALTIKDKKLSGEEHSWRMEVRL